MKNFFLTIAIALFTLLSFSQNDDSETGLIFGLTQFTVGDISFDDANQNGWFVGIYSDLYSSEHWGGQGEFNYIQQQEWWGLQLGSFQKYYFSENFPLNLQAGLQLDYYSSKRYKDLDGDWKFYYGLGVGLDFGRWLLQARYVDELFGSTDFKYTSVGVGYSF